MSDLIPPRRSAFGRPSNLDLERCLSVELGDRMLAHPEYSRWALHSDPHPVKPRWWLTFYPFVVVAENPDESIEVRNPNELIDRYRSPGAIESDRRYLQVPMEKAKALTRHFKVELPPGFFPATPEGIEAPPIDYEALVTTLRDANQGNPAALVEYMAKRKNAPYDEIKVKVIGNPDVGDAAVRKLTSKTTKHLVNLCPTLYFSVSAGYVWKRIRPPAM